MRASALVPSSWWAVLLVACLLVGLLPPPAPVRAADPAEATTATVLAVSAGGYHTCAIRTDGTLACWGDNRAGQATPPDGTFTAVSAGLEHTCAIKADGTVVASLGGGQIGSIWLFDVWSGGEPRRIATLPATDVPEGSDPPSAPCLEWVPGGGS